MQIRPKNQISLTNFYKFIINKCINNYKMRSRQQLYIFQIFQIYICEKYNIIIFKGIVLGTVICFNCKNNKILR